MLFVIHTYRPFYQSRPGRFPVWSTSGVAALAVLMPYLPLAAVFGFVPLPATMVVFILVMTLLYVLKSELVEHAFFTSLDKRRG